LENKNNFDEMWEHNFKYCEGIENKYSRSKTNIKHMRFINKDDKLEKIRWEYSMTQSTTKRRDNKGQLKKYPTFRCAFPPPLLENRPVGDHIFLYEHFEQICVAFEEPSSNTKFTKLKLNDSVAKKTIRETNVNQYKRITVPKKYWDITKESKCVIEYYPYKKDYLTNEYGLITIDVITPSEETE